MFKASLETPCIRSLNSYMGKYLVSIGYKMYCGSTKLGKLYYDAGIHTTKEVEHLYKVVVDKYKLEKRKHKSHVHVVQTTSVLNFQQLVGFDYRDKLDSLILPEFVQLIDSMTTSKKSETTSSSQLYNSMRKLRIYMIISLMCYTKKSLNNIHANNSGSILLCIWFTR